MMALSVRKFIVELLQNLVKRVDKMHQHLENFIVEMRVTGKF